MIKILTFDIEEWFHILDNKKTKTVSDWTKFDSRIRTGMDLIFDILDKTEKSATFFVVGWMAEKYPEIIRPVPQLYWWTNLGLPAKCRPFRACLESCSSELQTLCKAPWSRNRCRPDPGSSSWPWLTKRGKW